MFNFLRTTWRKKIFVLKKKIKELPINDKKDLINIKPDVQSFHFFFFVFFKKHSLGNHNTIYQSVEVLSFQIVFFSFFWVLFHNYVMLSYEDTKTWFSFFLLSNLPLLIAFYLVAFCLTHACFLFVCFAYFFSYISFFFLFFSHLIDVIRGKYQQTTSNLQTHQRRQPLQENSLVQGRKATYILST